MMFLDLVFSLMFSDFSKADVNYNINNINNGNNNIHFLFCDTCINRAHVSNRSKFDTSFTFMLSFVNGVSNK